MSKAILLQGLVLVLLGAAPTAPAAEVVRDTGQVLVAPQSYPLVHRMPAPGFEPSVAYQWLDILLLASGRDAERFNPRPTVLSRTMAIVLTAMYDAWAAYDDVAVGTRLGDRLRRKAMVEIHEALRDAILEPVIEELAETGEMDRIAERLLRRETDPYTIAEEVARRYMK